MIYPSPSAAGKLRLDSGWSGCRLCLKMWKLASWQAPVSLPATFLMCLLFIITWTWCHNASKKAKIGSVHGSSSYPEDRTKWTSISSPATSPTISITSSISSVPLPPSVGRAHPFVLGAGKWCHGSHHHLRWDWRTRWRRLGSSGS